MEEGIHKTLWHKPPVLTFGSKALFGFQSLKNLRRASSRSEQSHPVSVSISGEKQKDLTYIFLRLDRAVENFTAVILAQSLEERRRNFLQDDESILHSHVSFIMRIGGAQLTSLVLTGEEITCLALSAFNLCHLTMPMHVPSLSRTMPEASGWLPAHSAKSP